MTNPLLSLRPKKAQDAVEYALIIVAVAMIIRAFFLSI